MLTRSAATLPLLLYGLGCPPSCGMECEFPLAFVGWLWGFWVQLQLLFWVKRYKVSSRQGLREGLGCRFVGVDSLCLV